MNFKDISKYDNASNFKFSRQTCHEIPKSLYVRHISDVIWTFGDYFIEYCYLDNLILFLN